MKTPAQKAKARRDANLAHQHEDLLDALHDIEQSIRENTAILRELVRQGGRHGRG